MKIIKHGNPKKNKPDAKFVCEHCGCVFIAEWGEYEKHDSYQGNWVESICPECKRRTTCDEEKAIIREYNI